MRSKEQDAAQMAIKREDFLKKGFELFSSKTIEIVSMQNVADACGYGIATLYRYFNTKQVFVIAVATWKWNQFMEENRKRRPKVDFAGMTAAEIYEFYLESFLELYVNHRDLLRFNQFFNIYIQSEKIDAKTISPYKEMISGLKETFHGIYLRAQADKTMRTDVSEESMFSTTLHLMLAAVTRYAVGLAYIPEKGFDALEELKFQKMMLLKSFITE